MHSQRFHYQKTITFAIDNIELFQMLQLLDKPLVPAVLIDVLPNVVVAMRGLNPTSIETDESLSSSNHDSYIVSFHFRSE